MVVYCFDTLLAHYNGEEAPPPAFEDGQQYALPLSLTHVICSIIFRRKLVGIWRWRCWNVADRTYVL